MVCYILPINKMIRFSAVSSSVPTLSSSAPLPPSSDSTLLLIESHAIILHFFLIALCLSRILPFTALRGVRTGMAVRGIRAVRDRSPVHRAGDGDPASANGGPGDGHGASVAPRGRGPRGHRGGEDLTGSKEGSRPPAPCAASPGPTRDGDPEGLRVGDAGGSAQGGSGERKWQPRPERRSGR